VRRVHDRAVRDGGTAAGVALAAVAAGALQAAATSGSPARGGDEGALVSAAWAATRGVPEAARTFSGVAPTLATAHLAAWDRLTGAAGRAPNAVAGGRELMVVATVAGLGLLWLLARRVGLPRWAAAVALAAAGLSPLAVDLHRTVSPANLAVPWLLAAFVLARSRRPRPATWIGGGACLGAAVAIAPLVAAAAPAAARAKLRLRSAQPKPRCARRLCFPLSSLRSGPLGPSSGFAPLSRSLGRPASARCRRPARPPPPGCGAGPAAGGGSARRSCPPW
jgi:hypothetical protein